PCGPLSAANSGLAVVSPLPSKRVSLGPRSEQGSCLTSVKHVHGYLALCFAASGPEPELPSLLSEVPCCTWAPALSPFRKIPPSAFRPIGVGASFVWRRTLQLP